MKPIVRCIWGVALMALASGSAAKPVDLNRELILTPHAGTAAEDREIVRWQERAGQSGATVEAYERLAWAYIAKARRTLDAGYHVLAEKTAAAIETSFGASAEAQLIRGHVAHQLHRFAAAERLARQLVATREGARELALLSDVLVDQGKLTEAIAVLEKMAAAKPGAEAFSRIAHVRWLKGDVDGAVEAYRGAFRATAAEDEEVQAWLLTRLSSLELQRGELAAAEKLAGTAVERLPAYPPGWLARGRVRLARGETMAAVADLRRAAELQRAPEIDWWLADALRLTGDEAGAAVVEQRLRERGALDDPRTLALFLATRGEDARRALQLAQVELKERRDVFSQDAVAWAALAAGEPGLAQDHLRAAMAEGTRDARLALHAAEIALRTGDDVAARRAIEAAREMSATLTPSERVLLARAAQD